jgi:hypothetical protein
VITNRIYLVYGAIVLALAGYSQFRGWSFANINEVKNVPNSIRDNPGSYRSVYSSYHHYTGGK